MLTWNIYMSLIIHQFLPPLSPTYHSIQLQIDNHCELKHRSNCENSQFSMEANIFGMEKLHDL